MRKRWTLPAAGALVGIALAVYFEPTHCVRGWLWGEAFFHGRPTSYWAEEIEQREYTETIQFGSPWEVYRRRPRWPEWAWRFFPEQQAQWPGLLDGDAEGLAVLQELRNHPSEEVREWAEIGINRLTNQERGAWRSGNRAKMRWVVPVRGI